MRVARRFAAGDVEDHEEEYARAAERVSAGAAA
jgi:hypothetical protein